MLPFVSLCTPTYNRRPFIPIMLECFRNQTYPKDKIEWIIVDDGTDKIEDLINLANIPQIKYYKLDQKMQLSDKRNYINTLIKNEYIVYMDDDDYYPPERIMHAITKLLENPYYLCAGSSEMYIYFNNMQKMVQFGPYNINHATAATFAFRKELLNQTKFENNISFTEENYFLKGYTIPLIQLDPLKTILVFAHDQNTIDKYEIYKKGGINIKDSDKTIENFIKNSNEDNIKNFFVDQLPTVLKSYEEGSNKNKLDIIKQKNDNNFIHYKFFQKIKEKRKL